MNCATAIRVFRAARGISQKDLAIAAQLDPSYISLLEKGKRSPGLKNLERLAGALEVPLYLMLFFSLECKQVRAAADCDKAYMGQQLMDVLFGERRNGKSGSDGG